MRASQPGVFLSASHACQGYTRVSYSARQKEVETSKHAGTVRNEIFLDVRLVFANPVVDLLSLNQQTVWPIARRVVGFDGVCRILDFWQRDH